MSDKEEFMTEEEAEKIEAEEGFTIEDGETIGEETIEEVEETKEESKYSWTKNIIEEEDEDILDTFPWEEEEEEETKVHINKAVIKSVAKHTVMVKILKFLYKRNEPFLRKQIKKGMKVTTVGYNIKILVELGLVRQVPVPFDRVHQYFEIVDREAAEKIFKRNLWITSFKLAKLLSLKNMIRIEDLKKNANYLIKCDKYGLTPDEGIESLKLNSRWVEQVFSDYHRGELIGFRRKEQ